jgi:hypothetical protein
MIKSPLMQKAKPTNKKDHQTSDMIGMPGTAFRKKVEKEIKGKPVEEKGKPTKTTTSVKPKSSPIKMITEKGSYEKGKVEKYSSKSAMVKHEKKESKPFEKSEGKKSPPTKMKKC